VTRARDTAYRRDHHVKIEYDEDTDTAYGECQECCWACNGRTHTVEGRADAHEAEPR
jgi:hypothetical protein